MDLYFKDFFFIDPPANTASGRSSDPNVRQTASSCRGLKVILSASHAGKLTKNSTLYPPTTFQRCSHTFVSPYQKAVQTHHDDKSDPIGRIIGARYLPYQANDFTDSHKDIFLHFKDKLSKTTMLDSVRFLEEAGVLFDRDWKGLGELELETLITDQLAVEKILDGRYNTVSVGMEPHQVYCSICNKDWLSDREPCEHSKGKKDEETERLMYLISGDVTGMEVSYINHPADDLAFNKEFDVVNIGQETSKENPYSVIDSLDRRTVVYELLDAVNYEKFIPEKTEEEKKEGSVLEAETSETEKTMTIEEIVTKIIEDSSSVTEEDAMIINVAIEDKVLTAADRKRLSSKTFCGPGKSYPVPDRQHGATALSYVKQHGSPSLQKRVRACVCRKYPSLPSCQRNNDSAEPWTEEILKELESVVKHPVTGLDTTLGQVIFGTNDYLDEQDIKKLPNSVFCGPSRSFHIISIDHYLAAKELLDLYQGEGDTTIMTTKLEDLKKVLEEGTSDKTEEPNQETKTEDNQETKETPQEDNGNACLLDGLDDAELIKLFMDMEKQLVSRSLRAPRQCFECESKDEERKELQDKLIDAEKTIEVLRKEVKVAINDCSAADKALIELNKELQDLYSKSVVSLTMAVEDQVNVEELRTSISEMEVESLKDSFVKLQDKATEIAKLHQEGLTREPPENEKVTTQDAVPVNEEKKPELPKFTDNEIVYFRRLKKFSDESKLLASTHLQELKNANKISKDLTLDQICDIVEQL